LSSGALEPGLSLAGVEDGERVQGGADGLLHGDGGCSMSGLGLAYAGGAAFGGIGGALDPGLTKGDSIGCGQSFTAATLVVLASGATVPISSLTAGEKVKAVNTKTGKADIKTVQAVLVKWDTDLYDLTVKTAHGTEVIDTTAAHLFWDPYLHQWIPASHLKTGEHLLTANGIPAVADGGTTPKDHDGWMWDLTVQDDHDFYVEPAVALPPSRAGPTAVAVLVHNCGDGNLPEGYTSSPALEGDPYHPDSVEARIAGNADLYPDAVRSDPELQWEENPKHGQFQRGNAAPEPTDPLGTLQNSVPIGANTTRRVGADAVNGEFAVFDETYPDSNVFHGHVRSWDELSTQMQNALVRAGMATRRGGFVG
jgi:hypothetical protein